MSPKQQRKFHGIRRGKSRRGWSRSVREELTELEARAGDRRRPPLGIARDT